MEDVYVGGHLWRASITEARGGLLLIGDAREFDELYVEKHQPVVFERKGVVCDTTVTAVLRCPAGEPEAWMWLSVTSESRPARRRMERARQKSYSH